MGFDYSKRHSSNEIIDMIKEDSKKILESSDILSIAIILHDNTSTALNELYRNGDKLKAINDASGDHFILNILMPSTDKDDMFNNFSDNYSELNILPASGEGLKDLSSKILATLFPTETIKLPSLIYFGFQDDEIIYFFRRYLGGYKEDELFEFLLEVCKDVDDRLQLIKPEFRNNKTEINLELKRGGDQIVYKHRGKKKLKKILLIEGIVDKIFK